MHLITKEARWRFSPQTAVLIVSPEEQELITMYRKLNRKGRKHWKLTYNAIAEHRQYRTWQAVAGFSI